MIEAVLSVGLVVERRKLTGPWGGFAWRPVTIFATSPDVEPWTSLGGNAETARYFAGEYSVCLYSTDTANYRDNLESGTPKLWIVLRADGPEPPIEVLAITADPAEGEANTEAGSNVVETLPMPLDIAAAVAEFIAAHHVERPVIKRRRDRAEPDVRWRGGAGPGPAKPRTGDKE